MFSYAGRLLASRPTLWAAALACAALGALPGAVIATLLIQPITMLLLTADLGLAAAATPDVFTDRGWVLPTFAAAGCIIALAFNRLYAVLLWSSDEERSSGWRAAWDATKRVWVKLLALNLGFLFVQLAALAALVVGTAVILSLSSGVGTLVMLLGTTLLIALRTIGKIAVTLAARSILLDGSRIGASLRVARTLLKEQRRQVVAAWASLLALGVAVWVGGRIVTPILQDTAFEVPVMSGYSFAREAAQLAFAIPLEAFLLVVAAAVWTAVYRGIDNEIAPTSTQSFLPRALAVLVVLVIIGNGVSAAIEVAWRNTEERRERAIRLREISPEDAVVATNGPSAGRPTYEVHARLEDEELTWTTTVRYRNPSNEALKRLPLYVYPAAFTGDVQDLPLAEDLLSMPNRARGEVRSGTFEVVSVTDRTGRALQWERDDTVLSVNLDEPVAGGRLLEVDVELRAGLPTWPLRYGIWDGVAQLGNWIPTVPVRSNDRFVIYPYEDIGDPFFASVADYLIEIDVEEGMGVVGTGALTDVSTGGGGSVWRFEAPRSRDAAFAVGDALRGLELEAGATVRTWYNGEDSLAGARIAEDSAAAVRHYSGIYGPPGPSEIDIVSLQNPLGGMEYPGLVFVSSGFSQLEGLPLLPELVEHSGFQEEQERYVAGHELAHQWWYADVGNDQFSEPWLDEGFAEASTRLWLLNEDGNERTWRIAHLEDGASLENDNIGSGITAFEDNSDYSDAIYDAGGQLLVELRALSGDAAYDDLMMEWHTSKHEGVGTIDEFIELTGQMIGNEAEALLERHLK